MRTAVKAALLVCACAPVIVFAVGMGSVYISPAQVLGALSLQAEGLIRTIVWTMRLPRVALAFLAGAALGVSGAVMQSVLKNPLASSYTLGVSSGASLGAYLVMISGFTLPLIGAYTLPLAGFVCGLATVAAAVVFAGRNAALGQNHTIVLAGMVFSLFVNAVLSLVSALFRGTVERLVFWQMGTFAMKGWTYSALLLPVVIIGLAVSLRFAREMDIMTFGDEAAMAMGVRLRRVKWTLLIAAAAMTGSAISLAGVIGFIDLIAPHIARRLFGSRHALVIPAAALFSGAFMVLCDLAARTLIPPSELPVGAVTALIGAPFFAYVYFGGRRGKFFN